MACSFYAPSTEDYARPRQLEGMGGANGQGGDSGVGASGNGGGSAGLAGEGTVSEAGAGGEAGEAGGTGGGAPCAPAPERCNGVDDDCDNIIDEGCPTGFLRASTTKETSLGDSTGGTTFADLCANDELIVGLQLGFSGWLYQLTGICQRYSLAVNTQLTPWKYSVAFEATRLLPSHPASTNGALQQVSCAAGMVLVGVHVYEQYGNAAHTGNPYITGLSISCAAPTFDPSATNPQLTWAGAVELGPFIDSSFNASEALRKDQLLSNGRLVVGLHGSAGFWVDNVGLTSSSVQVLIK